MLVIVTELLIGGVSAISTSTMGLINPSVGIVVSSSTPLFTSIAILILTEYNSILKIRYNKIKHWNNIITLL